jgi:hypothetical protein
MNDDLERAVNGPAIDPTLPDSAATREEQRRRWNVGDRISAEALLSERPHLRSNPDDVVDIIYAEYLLREELGEKPAVEEYLLRFPDFSTTLRDQVAIHDAMTTWPPAGQSPPPPDTDPHSTGTEPDGGAGSPATVQSTPKTFGRYRILERIGHGGMGTVYLAHDPALDRRVALKVPRFGNDSSDRAESWFRREAKIAATLTHPNLCPIFDVGEHDGQLYFTMPYLQGETLAERLTRSGALPEHEAIRLAVKVARAVAEAHRAGVIHRDLKPSNVMIDARGEPIVMDFGLARHAETEGDVMTPSGTLLGTPAYMAPEQITGEPSSLGDVYSLGVLLYHMLRGAPPYTGTFNEVLKQSLAGKPESLSRDRSDVTPALEAVCLKAMAREPLARYASLEDLAEALDGVCATKTAVEAPVPIAARKRARWVRIVPITALVAVIAAGGAWLAAQRPVSPSASLRPGSTWKGSFRFRPPLGPYTGDVVVRVTSRTGNRFVARYATEAGAYEWECQGIVDEAKISWTFTRAIREREPRSVVGRARVSGQISGDVMSHLIFDHGNDVADIELIRDPR